MDREAPERGGDPASPAATGNLVIAAQEGDVLVIRLNDPATLNAASLDMVAQLQAALDGAGACRAILLTGEGRGFCSGANLAGRAEPGRSGGSGERLRSHYNPLMRRLRDLPVPVVTAVNDPAAGIGCALALAGDLVVMSQDAYFLQAFGRIGLVPDGGSAFLLVKAVGRARAMEMMLLAERVGAAQALDWGLVNRVVPAAELMPAAMALARRLAAGPTRALALTRRLAWHAAEAGFEAQLALEADLQDEAGRTDDHREGIDAFFAKRDARFTGR